MTGLGKCSGSCGRFALGRFLTIFSDTGEQSVKLPLCEECWRLWQKKDPRIETPEEFFRRALVNPGLMCNEDWDRLADYFQSRVNFFRTQFCSSYAMEKFQSMADQCLRQKT